MNIIKIYGGLGNQMFQYAFGRQMAENGIEVAFDISWSNQPHDPPRPYGLDKIRTTVQISSFIKTIPTIHEADFYRFNSVFQKLDNHNFFGYWQNIQYIQGILPQLKEEFKIRPDFLTDEYVRLKTKIVLEKESIALHIRRGDYLTKGHHLLPIEYYTEALKQVEGTLYIFSDDIPWCKTQFENAIFVDLPDYLCLDLMKTCTHKITANSTFSWWAGILGDTDGKIFAPKRWRLNDKEENVIEEEKFIPTNWIRI
jgi:hypothetical protein